ncbi:MAG: shikimate kinase [Rhodospirillaceae bacterium]|nr:shikimate kinase [Rhodospirillaceae bacterium]|tara:strand:+ start:7234 stop:7797 length:564 start_codon:yes stop_codon:yes gene_type:complete
MKIFFKNNIINKPIVLIGIMGAGKTTLGKKLAKHLDMEFYDSDEEIESKTGLSIKIIFKEQGELAFREMEEKVVTQLLLGSKRIIATGGGAFINPNLRKIIKKRAITIWLKTDVDLATIRVKDNKRRPLLNNVDVRETLSVMIEKRNPIYSEAHVTVESENIPHNKMISKLLYELETQAAIKIKKQI